MSERYEVFAKEVPQAVGSYPHARREGGYLHISGMGPREPDQKEIPGVTLTDDGETILDYDVAKQARSVFRNIDAILQTEGLSNKDLTRVTVLLTNMKKDFNAFNREYGNWMMGVQVRPARATYEVGALPTPIAVELICEASYLKK